MTRKSGRELTVSATIADTAVAPWWPATVGQEPIAQRFVDMAGQVVDTIQYERDVTATSRGVVDKLGDVFSLADYGADPTGVTSANAAFALADTAALLVGGTIVVPAGEFLIDANLSIASPVIYQGRLIVEEGIYYQDSNPLRLSEFLKRHETSEDAFKAMLFALYRSGRPRIADGEGLTVNLSGPINVAEVTGVTSFSVYHCLTGFKWQMDEDQAEVEEVVVGTAVAESSTLSLADTSDLRVGMEVTGTGIGRGVYIKTIDSPTAVTLNVPAWGNGVAQNYTFIDYPFMLDWRDFTSCARLRILDSELQCAGFCSGIIMAFDGIDTVMNRVRFTNIKGRGVVDYWRGSGGLSFDLNDMTFAAATNADAVGIISTSNDVKVRSNRITTCKHHMIYHGGGVLVSGNHWWGGDNAGCIFTGREYKSTIIGNYIDNNWVELSDEGANLDNSKFLGLINITGNHWTSNNAPSAAWRFIKLAPHVADRPIAEISVTSNTFKDFANGSVPFRIDGVITTDGSIDADVRTRVFFVANGFKGIGNITADPQTVIVVTDEADIDLTDTHDADFDNRLPFEGHCNTVLSTCIRNPTGAADATVFPVHFVRAKGDIGSNFIARVVTDIDCNLTAVVTASANTEF